MRASRVLLPRLLQGCPGNSKPSRLVVPAKAGTHTALPQNRPLRRTHVAGGTGPRFRGDDKEIPSLDSGTQMPDPRESAFCLKVADFAPDSPAAWG
jgi:hypothetical protein